MDPTKSISFWISVHLLAVLFMLLLNHSLLSVLNLETPPSLTPSPSLTPPSSPSLTPSPSLIWWVFCLIFHIFLAYFVDSLRLMLSWFPNLRETHKLSITLFLTLLFHGVFIEFGESSVIFSVYVAVSCSMIVLLKLLQAHDDTMLTEDIGASFLKIGLEYILKDEGYGSVFRVLLCLIPFSLSVLSRFSGRVDLMFYNNFILSVERRKVYIHELLESARGRVIAKVQGWKNKVVATVTDIYAF